MTRWQPQEEGQLIDQLDTQLWVHLGTRSLNERMDSQVWWALSRLWLVPRPMLWGQLETELTL